MKIKIRQDAAMAYIHRTYRKAHPQCGMLHRPEWVEALEKVQGQWLEVDTQYLFSNQFNTTPIEGVSEIGMRIMIEDIDEIQDDVRIGVSKCNWCGGDDRHKPGICGKCGRTDCLQPLLPAKRP